MKRVRWAGPWIGRERRGTFEGVRFVVRARTLGNKGGHDASAIVEAEDGRSWRSGQGWLRGGWRLAARLAVNNFKSAIAPDWWRPKRDD